MNGDLVGVGGGGVAHSVKSSFKFLSDEISREPVPTHSPACEAGCTLMSLAAPSLPVLCKVDLSKEKGLSLHFEKLRPKASDCEMKENSVRKEKITVTSTSDLFFQDCRPEDVRVTASRVIGRSRFNLN